MPPFRSPSFTLRTRDTHLRPSVTTHPPWLCIAKPAHDAREMLEEMYMDSEGHV